MKIPNKNNMSGKSLHLNITVNTLLIRLPLR